MQLETGVSDAGRKWSGIREKWRGGRVMILKNILNESFVTVKMLSDSNG
jgi:hypothetical protein